MPETPAKTESEPEGCADSTGSRLVPFRNCEGKVVWFEANLTLAQMMDAGVESIHLSSMRQPNTEDPKIYFSANAKEQRPL